MASWLYRLHFFLGFILFSFVNAQQSFWPAAIPLAVRSPYLNSWQTMQNGSANPLMDWSQFWTRRHITAWTAFIKVDDVPWKLLGGYPGLNATVLDSTTITPTRTILRVIAGPVAVTMSFLSPIEPDDPVKQSFPFSYMYVDVESLDGSTHEVRLYTDISGEWISNGNGNLIRWDTIATSDVFCHSATRQVPLPHIEDSNMSEDSTIYYAMLPGNGVQWQTAADVEVRNTFRSEGVIRGGKDTQFRSIGDKWPVFAYSVNLGTIAKTAEPVVWAIGQHHDPSVQYSSDGTTILGRSPYWRTKYNTDITNAITDFLKDFSSTRDRAIQLDEKIAAAAQKVYPKYADLVSLAARQAFAGVEVTTSRELDSNWNTSDIKAFMKNMGNRQTRINPVETIYSAMPIFLYIDPPFLGNLLAPLLEYQATPAYFNQYAAVDLGVAYPNATGNAREHQQGVEQSANMLIMVLAHARYSGDGALLSRFYPLLKKWTQYLSANSLNFTNQVTGDGRSQPNNANLAIKGIIGIKAMSEISKAVGETGDSNTFSTTASELFGQWKSQAMPDNHLLLRYDNSQSDGLFYNLYADRLLKTSLIPEEVFSNQAAYYNSTLELVTIAPGQTRPASFGPAYDNSEQAVVKPHWTMFTAAALRNYPVANTLIDMVHSRASSNSTAGIFPASYRSDSGEVIDGEASPALGAMFALLALDLEPKEIQAPPLADGSTGGSGTTPPSNSSSNAGVIAGAVVGALVGICIIAFAAFFLWRRKQNSRHHIEYNPELMFAPQFQSGNQSYDPPLMATTTSPYEPRPFTTKGVNRQPTHIPNTSISTAFTHPPISPTTPPSSRSGETLSAQAAEMLRNEVADLRREMNEMRERGYEEPPPRYPA